MSVTLLKLQVGWTCQNKPIPASFPLADALRRRRKLPKDTAHCRFIQPLSHDGLDKQTAALTPSPPTSSTWWEVSTCTQPQPSGLGSSSLCPGASHLFPFDKKKMAGLGWNWKPCISLTWAAGAWQFLTWHLLASPTGPRTAVPAAR